MRSTTTIGPNLRRGDLGDELFEALHTIYTGDFKSLNVWGILLPSDDPRIQPALTLLQKFGYEPKGRYAAKTGPGAKSFPFRVEREYDHSDWEKFRYLEMIPRDYAEWLDFYTEDPPQIWVPPDIINRKGPFLRGPYERIILVPDRIRRVLESGSLKGLRFAPVYVTHKFIPDEKRRAIPWDQIGEPWWDVMSDVILPPISPSCELVDNKGQPYQEGVSLGGPILVEGFIGNPELRYRQRDLADLDFDIALTHERFRVLAEHKRYKIVSQRFYRFCRDHGLDAYYKPVHLEDDDGNLIG